MITPSINLKLFKKKSKNKNVKRLLLSLISKKDELLMSLSKNYKDSYTKKTIKKYNKNLTFRLIGMGGSTLGSQTLYQFLNHKIKKKFLFIDNLQAIQKKNNSKITNIVISKSGNTIETIVNANILIKKKDKNIFITENKHNYLHILAKKLKAEVIHHNNFIGGRYSVLSEVGMLPAELMGLKSRNFRQFNSLMKNKHFTNALISNVSTTLTLIKQKKYNSIIINYDEKSENLFYWYQQLIAESLGKKKKGLLPIVSNMPKDNHSLMQLYLDGFKNNFFTFFYVNENKSDKINNKNILSQLEYLKNKYSKNIIYAQKNASESIFKKKGIPFRSFEIKRRDEKTLGELFCFFILETILLGKSLNLNPFDQPSVELIKKETKNFLI